MSKPMTLAQMRAAFTKWGVPHAVVGRPETHNRNHKGRWGDVKGIVLHHFGTDTSDKRDLPIIVNGHAALPGPLSQWFLGDDNVVDIVSTGRCNHAGKGSRATFNHVVKGDWNGSMLRPGPDEVDFNAYFYGCEVGYSGKTWMTDARYRVMLLMCAATCDFYGWSEKSVISHAELTKRKWDMGKGGRAMDMSVVRSDLRVLLARGPQGAAGAVSTARPQFTPPKAPALAGAPVDPGKAPYGPIAASFLRRGQKPTWSVRRYKQVVFYAHGPSYRAAAVKRWGADLSSDRWDACAERMTEDLYRSLDKAYPGEGWGEGDLREPGRALLRRLGFEVK